MIRATLRRFASVFMREAEILTGDLNLVTIIIIAPVVYTLLMGSVYLNKVETDVPIAVVDGDHSTTSRMLIRSLDVHQVLRVSDVLSDVKEMQERIFGMNNAAIVFIPKGFEAGLNRGRGADLQLTLDNSRFLVSNDVNRAVNDVVRVFNEERRLGLFTRKGVNEQQARVMVEPVREEIRPLFNSTESYGDFLLPGMFVLVLQQTLLMGLAQSVARERERSTVRVWRESAGGRTGLMAAGKGSVYVAVMAMYFIVVAVLFTRLFRLNFLGSTGALIALTFLFLCAIAALALFFGSLFRRKIITLQFFAFTSYPIFLTSGYSWPMEAMPLPLQWLVQVLPSTPYFSAYARITQMDAGWEHVWPQCAHLAVLTGIGVALALWRTRVLARTADREPGSPD